MRSVYKEMQPDIREELFYLTPEQLVERAETSPEVIAALNSESFCRDYYNRRVPSDLQLIEAPMGVAFCTLIRALPLVLAQLATIRSIVMRWERCVVPRKEELNWTTNTSQFSRCVSWSGMGGDDLNVIQLAETGEYLYVLSPWNNEDPHIRLDLRAIREGRRLGPRRVGEWRVPLAQLRALLVALVATRGHLFENTERYSIALVRSLPLTRMQMEHRETFAQRARDRRAARELPSQEGYDE